MKRQIFIFITATLIACLIPIQAFAARKLLSVPDDPAWFNCGACCASMVTQYFKKDTTNREKVAWDNRTSYNKNCSAHKNSSDWHTCTSYYGVRALSGQQGGFFQEGVDLQFNLLKRIIDSNGPSIISLGKYLGGGHAIVGKGYDTGTYGTEQWVIYNDPYDGAGHSATMGWIEKNWDTRGYTYWK